MANLLPRADDPDLALVRAMAQGDPCALDELYQRLGPGLLAYLCSRLGERTLAEEVLQDVMLCAWRAAPAFRGDCRVRTWLLVIARRRAINAFHRRSLPTTALENAPSPAPSRQVEAAAEQNEQADRLHRTLQKLPDGQREALELVFYHGLNGTEAARVLGVPSGTVKSRLSRARFALEKLLKEDEGFR